MDKSLLLIVSAFCVLIIMVMVVVGIIHLQRLMNHLAYRLGLKVRSMMIDNDENPNKTKKEPSWLKNLNKKLKK